jgi:uncharacterized protein YggE
MTANSPSKLFKTGVSILILTAIIMIFGGIPRILQAQEGSSMSQRTISVTGTGTAYGTPDTVYITFGVDMVDDNIDTAVSTARESLNTIIAAVRSAGVEERDIQTTYFNVFPEDRYSSTGEQTGMRQFRVSLGISVTVRAIDNAAPVISAALNAGANSVQNLSFGIADTRPLESEARTAAVSDARSRAEELAQAFGVTLGEVIRIDEGFSGGGIPLGGARMDSAAISSNQIVPGQLSVSSNIQVTFAIAG